MTYNNPTTNISPYYDDFDDTKGFLRLLFRPGRAVQGRELTQLQTLLQDQIGKFGNHIFEEKTVIMGGDVGVSINDYVRTTPVEGFDPTTFLGLDIYGATGTDYAELITDSTLDGYKKARITAVIPATTDDPYDIFFTNQMSGSTFGVGDTFRALQSGTSADSTNMTIPAALSADETGIAGYSLTGSGNVVTVDAGLFYVDKFFIKTDQQNYIPYNTHELVLNETTRELRIYETDPTKSVGFEIGHSVVEYTSDSSLLDGSEGTSNFTAPGADRYKMSLTLGQRDYTSYGTGDSTEVDNSLVSEENYFELVRLHNGNIQNKLIRTGYSGLDDYLAKRTYDESGNYIVSGFNLELREHLRNSADDTHKDGMFTATQGGETGKYALKLGRGSAYVEGYEYNTFGETIISADKTRGSTATNSVSGENVITNLGLHVKVTNSAGGITLGKTTTDFDNMDEVYFVGPTGLALDGTTAGAVGNSGGVIGKGRIQTLISSGTDYASVFLADIEMGVCGGIRYPFYLTNSIHGASANTRTDGFVHDNVAGDKYMTISPTHGKDATNSYQTTGFESRFTGNVFHVENAGVKSITGLDYTARVCVNKTVPSTSTVTITTSDINDTIAPNNTRVQFPLTSGSEAISVNSVQVYGINGADGSAGEFLTPVASDAALSLGTNGVYFYDNTEARNQLQFKVGTTYTNDSVKIFANVVIDDSGVDSHDIRREKTKVEGQSATVTLGAVNANGLIEGKIPYSDVYKINGISGGNDADLTEKFFVDLGNKPSFYDHATLIAMNSSGLTQGTQVTVNFDYYSHSTGNQSGGGFGPFTANSYPNYEDIPAIRTRTLGTVSLRDCLDFRPARENVADSTNFNTVFVPYHSTSDDLNAIEVNYQHYMGRIDFLYLRNDKVLKLVQGTPAPRRRPPEDVVDGMLLATLKIPPYVYNVNDIRVSIEDNKRYTMKDIGRIKSKVDRMEYYTALSLMEQSAENAMIVDANGLPRFKNGILADPFAGHNIGDATNPDYNILIDDMMNAAYCPQVSDNIDLIQHNDTEGLVLTDDDCYVLKSSTVHLIEQTVRSAKISVNPYNVVSFTGDIKLRPETDTWTDTTRLPAQALSQSIDARVEGLSNITDQLGAVVAGTNLQISDVIASGNRAGAAARNAVLNRNRWGNPWWSWNNGQLEDIRARGAVLNNLNLPAGSVQLQERRTGRRTMDTMMSLRAETFQASESTTNSTMNLGDRVVETSNIPFMRAKNIRITATGLRPNTRVYPFFDGQAVTENCTLATYGSSRAGILTEALGGDITGDLGGALTTDGNGKIGLHFDLPAGDFRTGGRQFKLTDHEGNSAQLESTFADAEYTATGLLQVVQATSVTTSVRRSQVQRTQAGWEEAGFTNRRWVDPVAQSIMISADEYPNGVFAKSVDLFFAQIDDSLPVSVELRPMVNGYPSSGEHIPLSKVVLDPSETIASTDWSATGTDKTRFNFSTPVYLTPGEYCIVVISNSDKYEVWYSTMGEYKLNNDGTLGSTKITAQPYTGSFFKSQNASTWTADQNSDLCFRFSICDFTTSGLEGTLDLSAELTPISEAATNHYHSTEDTEGSFTYRHQRFHEIRPNFTQMSPGDTSISHSTLVQRPNNFGDNVHQTIPSRLGQTSIMDERKSVILSTQSSLGQGLGADSKSLIHKIKFTGSQFLSPVIDAERMSMGITEYLINDNKNLDVVYDQILINGVTANAGVSAAASGNYNGEYEPNAWGDNQPLVRYITRPVVLEEGINAQGLSVYLTQDVPVGTDIHVFARTLEEQSETSIRREKWVRILPDSTPPKGTGLREIEYKLQQESEFGQFQVKFVMYQTAAGLGNQYPIVKDLRAIAVT